MPKSLCMFIALLFLACSAPAETLTFAPLPMESPETVARQWKPLLGYLKDKLGLTLRIDYSKDNAEVLKKFQAGQIDLAQLGPLPYVILKQQFPAAEPVVIFNEKNGQPRYTCAIVASVETEPRLDVIKVRKIALTQPLSTCGYLATDALLHGMGNDLEVNRFRYLTRHDEVALAVIRGEFDAGGMKTAIAEKYAHLGLAVLAETKPLPSQGLVANTEKVSAERIAQIRQALLDADSQIRATWGENLRYGVVPASDKDYDGIREFRLGIPIAEQGNF